VKLRALTDADVPALRALQHAQAGPRDPRWSTAELRASLFDHARDHGRRVVVAARRGAVAGCAGWVEAPPMCFGAPVVAGDDEAAAALVAHVVGRARELGATLRISATPGEEAKRRALLGAGMTPIFDFITVSRPVRRGDGHPWSRAGRRVRWAELDAAAFADVHNDTFAGVPNATPLTADEMRAQLDEALVDRDATAAWASADGYLAFVQVERDADEHGRFGTLAAIGVRAAARGHGLAAAIVDDVLARIAAEVSEARALIASTNAASLALFASRGFTERCRRTVFELAAAL